MGKSRTKTVVTSERLREKLDYDLATGIFIWKDGGPRWRGPRSGTRAGGVDPNGYRYIRIDGIDYLAQRLAWFWVHGCWPEFLRFEDGNKDNCAIGNLRDSSLVQPGQRDWRTKEGKSAQQKEYRATIADRLRGERMQKTFGISLEEYREMLARQDNVCAICEQPETATRNGKVRWLAVDHCHTTGKVRGLLCGNCNPMIGYAKDNVEVLEKAIKYLRSHEGVI